MMNIDSVRVRGLFGRFNHDLEFHTDERIMIMIGPNGFGKTTTLNLIDVLFNQSLGRLAGMPFQRVEVSFDRGASLVVLKDHAEQNDDGLPLKLIFRSGSGEPKIFRPIRALPQTLVRELDSPIFAIEVMIPVLDRVGVRTWRNRTTDEVLDLDEALTVFQDELSQLPNWLQEVRSTVAVRLIDTERLTRMVRGRGRYRSDSSRRAIQIYSEELAGLVTKSIAEYAKLSQALDRTFPARLVAGSSVSDGSVETLLEDLGAIKQQRSRLEEAGLLTSDQASIEIPDLARMDTSRRGVLAVYAQDTKQKLGAFDDLCGKINAFMRIANSHLRYKQVTVSTAGLKVVSSTGENLDLEMLSSGEQHELVILYELLFRTSENSLILIDEPELSLHVVWQEAFVNDLDELAELSDFRAILATHSPEIVGDRWDLAVELNGPNGR